LGYILAQKYLLISSLDQTLWRSALLATFNVPDVLVLDTKYRKLVKSWSTAVFNSSNKRGLGVNIT